MRSVGVFAVVVLALVCFGQEPPPSQAARRLDFVSVAKLEGAFEQKLKTLDSNDSVALLGACSGVYVSGYGLVFTIPLSLIPAPSMGPFGGAMTPQKADNIHKRMQAQLPVVKKALNDMLMQAAKTYPDLPAGEKLAVAVRLFYLDSEDKTGLPNQIVVSADRASALAGAIRVDGQ